MPFMPRSYTSSASSAIEDEDAITPCPLEAPVASEPASPTTANPLGAVNPSTRSPSPCLSNDCVQHRDVATATSSRRSSVQIIENGTEGDPERLWRRMLALQQIYGCYNSARMAAALESGNAESLLPSKACLDLLNENMSLLPEDADQRLHSWFDGLRIGRGKGRRHRSRSQ